MIDAPVSGGAPAVAEGRLLVMVGGDDDVVERCRPVFASYADPIVHLGALGSGQTTKLLNNLLFTANLGTAASTLALGEALGVLPDRLTEVISRGSGNSFALNVLGGDTAGSGPPRRHGRRPAAKGRPPARRRRRRRDRCRWGRAGRRRRDAVPHGTSTVRVGFIGAGRMGRPMVGRLVDAGHQVRALGRSDEKRSAISRIGRRRGRRDRRGRAPAPRRWCVCVFTDEQVRQICLADGLVAAMPAGSILVLHTTGSPRTAEAIAERATPRGVQVVDAPVSGGPHNAAAGALTLFVGGADDAVAAVRPVLSSYGDPILHVGPLGAGQKVKLVNNALFAAQIGLLSDAVELAAAARGGGVRAADRPAARQRGEPRAGHRRSGRFGGVVHRNGRRIRRQRRRGGPADRR